MSVLVWQITWLTLKQILISFFQEFLNQDRIFDLLQKAKIIPLCNSNEFECTHPVSYTPILLHPKLSKPIEAFVAERIFYLIKKHSLFSNNHFGGLKRTPTIDILIVLEEKIYLAWRNKKILSFLTFDVKKVFIAIAEEVLLYCFCQK